uniref:Uncharacterized protein n=1 Tax=Arundo donax TaxID=35708 RepID=A0A0A8YXM1_ARUDO
MSLDPRDPNTAILKLQYTALHHELSTSKYPWSLLQQYQSLRRSIKLSTLPFRANKLWSSLPRQYGALPTGGA